MTLERFFVHQAPDETRPLVSSMDSPLDTHHLDIPLYEETDFLRLQASEITGGQKQSCWSRTCSNLEAFFKIAGPGFVVAIGYMDPGNWATDLTGGAEYGYTLLSVILISNIMACFLQSLCVQLGVMTGKDLSQACRAYLHPYLNFFLFLLAEIAMIATDLAEVIGAAIALKLLFDIPFKIGIAVTCLDVLFILMFWNDKYQKTFEFVIFVLVLVVGGCFVALVTKTDPVWSQVAQGFVPSADIFKDQNILFIALGIMGATIMPHNLYIHSRLSAPRIDFLEDDDEITLTSQKTPVTPARVFTRQEKSNQVGLRIIETLVALTFAVFVNSGILIVAAAAFHAKGETRDISIEDAYSLLALYLGKPYAVIFAVALLLCAQSSTITGTMAGQIIMEGHLGTDFIMKPWIRRVITRLLAIVPAMFTAISGGDAAIYNLLLFSQVILSLQLPFAVWPLIYFTSSPRIMESKHLLGNETPVRSNCNWVMTVIGVLIATFLTVLNFILLVQVANGT